MALVVTAFGSWRAGTFTVTETDIPVAGLAQDVTLMHISDMHIGHHHGRGYIEKIVTETNRHHPEFHADPNDMSDVDLIEMVCDWTAMAQEFSQDGGSARGWADKTIGKRIAFDAEKRRFIYRMIEDLDRQQVANP